MEFYLACYLNGLTMFGATAQGDEVFENLVRYLNESRRVPKIAKEFPLAQIHAAQRLFLSKAFVGKSALIS
jgi:NADPH:quinone reductase-like Zn-dependent oxidoreductase